jgi:hypothetical protein
MRICRVGAALAVLALGSAPVVAQDAAPGPVVELDREPELTSTREWVRSPEPVTPFSPEARLEIEIVADAAGVVRSARPISGPPAVYEAAVAEALTWRYVPTIRDGTAVAVRFVSHLGVMPPEIVPAVHVPIPEADDLSGVVISMLQTGCLGPCPAFKVEIGGTGLVHFEGDVPLAARIDYRIDPAKVAALVEMFRQADFFSQRDAYEVGITDVPTLTTTITIGGETKSVFDNQGWMMGMPEALGRLEAEVVRTAMVPELIGCGEAAVELLRDAAIDFTRAADLLAGSVNCDDDTLFRALIEAGAPLTGCTSWRGTLDRMEFRNDDRRSAIIAAALQRPNAEDRTVGLRLAVRAGDPGLVRALAEGPFGPAALDGRDADGATPLLRAASTGSAEMVRLLLDLGAAPQLRDFKGNTALHVAASGDVVRALLAAGLDPDAIAGPSVEPMMGETPLATARSPDVAEALIAGGADIEKRNWRERTPIMEAEPSVIPVLIAAGADVNARDRFGSTALHLVSDRGAIDALIAAGADPDARDDRSLTPMLAAVADMAPVGEDYRTRARIVNLLEAGADPAEGRLGRTIRDAAVALGWSDVIRAIDARDAGAGP